VSYKEEGEREKDRLIWVWVWVWVIVRRRENTLFCNTNFCVIIHNILCGIHVIFLFILYWPTRGRVVSKRRGGEGNGMIEGYGEKQILLLLLVF
jgi:hypothetical protein